MNQIAVLLMAVLPSLAHAGSGFSRLNYLGRSPHVEQIRVLADGSTLAAGNLYWSDKAGSRIDGFIVRLTPTGAVDRKFARAGWIVVPHLFGKMEVLDDGRLLLCGAHDDNAPSSSAFWVARYLPTGKPDISFGSAGEVIKDFGPGEEYPRGMEVDPSGKVTLVGLSNRGLFGPNEEKFLTILRLMPNGQPDLSFGTAGSLFRKIAIGDVTLESVFTRTNGGLLLLTEARLWRGNGYSGSETFTFTAFKSDGQLDTSFGNGGSLALPIGSKVHLTDTIQTDDGSLILAGFYREISMTKTPGWIMKLDSDGSLNRTFATNGLANLRYYVSGVTVDRQGSYWFTASQSDTESPGLVLAHLTSSGVPDKRFGKDGVIIDSITAGKVFGQSSKLSVDAATGKVTVSAPIKENADTISLEDSDLIVTRFNSDGILDLAGFGN